MKSPFAKLNLNAFQKIDIHDQLLVSIENQGEKNDLGRQISNEELKNMYKIPNKSNLFVNPHKYHPNHNFIIIQTQMSNFNEISSKIVLMISVI